MRDEADDDATFQHGKKRNYALRRALLITAVIGAAIGLALLIKPMFDKGDSKKKNVVHQITLLKPPPPPPPPPKEEKPPEVKKEEVKVEEPKPQEAPPDQGDSKPAGEQLGLDADGAAGSDGFGLAARKGGQDITTIGGGAGDARSRYGWYAAILQRHFDQISATNKALQGRKYQASVKIWLDRDGRVARFELIGSSGDAEIDAALRRALAEAPALREPPPEGLPQPVRMRVTSKG